MSIFTKLDEALKPLDRLKLEAEMQTDADNDFYEDSKLSPAEKTADANLAISENDKQLAANMSPEAKFFFEHLK